MDVPAHRQVDGDKFICLDNIIQSRNCIIYSFGIGNDWTFEDQMDSLGNLYFTNTFMYNVFPG